MSASQPADVATPEPPDEINLDEILSAATKLACKILGGNSAAIALADEEGDITVRSQVGMSDEAAADWHKRWTDVPLDYLARTRRSYVCPDVAADDTYDRNFTPGLRLGAILVVPLQVGEKLVGCLAMCYKEAHQFSPEELQLASLFADHASISIESTTLLQQERQQRQRSETLLDVVSAPTLSLSLKQVLVKLCQSVLKLTVAERCSMFLFNEDTHTLEPVMSLGLEDPTLWERFRASAGLSIPAIKEIGEAIKAQEPIIAENAPRARVVPRFWTRTFGLKSLALYPLVHREKTIGMLEVDSFTKFVHFPAEEIETLAAIANQAAVIIENARIFEKEQRQRQRSEALVEVLTAASSTLSEREVLIKLCEAVVDISVGDRCSIFLLDSERGRLEPVMSLGPRDEKLWQKFRRPPARVRRDPAEQRFLEAATNWEKPIVIEDAENSPILPRWWIKTFALKSVVAYPLRVKDRTIGAMTVHTSRDRAHFPQEEIDTLAAVAKQAAAIIENARLYEQERQQRQRAEALVNVLSAGASDLSFRKVLAMICQAVVNITVGDRCSIFMVDEERRGLKPVMSLGVQDEALWQRFRNPAAGEDTSLLPEIHRLYEAVTEWEDPVVIEDAATTGLLSRWWVETFNLKSLVHYPLRVKDRTIGMMTVDAFRERVHFPQEEVDTLAAIANQAAVIIENARLYEQEREQRQRAEALVNVLSVAASDLSFRKVLATISQSVLDFSVGERCSIFLFNEETHTMEPVMAMGPGDAALFEKFRASVGLPIPEFKGIGEAIGAWEPIVEENAPASTALPLAWVKEFEVKSAVVYPLVHREKTVGILVVNTFTHFTHFPQDEIETLAAVAKQAAIIIENTRLHDKLREQAITDHLTGLFNHRHIHERLEEEFARAARNNRPFGVMMMDLDNFKFFNDAHGHLNGDEALKYVGGVLRDALRTTDIVGRYGGDEFLAILPETTRDEAENTGARILEALAARPFSFEEHETQLGMSIGIACYPYDSGIKQELLALADAALYEAKRLGAGRVVPARVSELEFVPARSLGFGLLQGLLNALAHKDPYTKRHCEDNVRYVDKLAERLHLSETSTESLRKAALLHDVGKIAIPDSTLMKPGPLDSEEWEVMQQHVRFGEMIVKGIAQISDAIEPVATHHERFDGKGYPRGLKGEDIPLLGRVLAVVDAYSAMTLDRPYRNALSKEVAVKELRRGAGTQFDPAVVDAFLATIEAGEEPKTKVA